MKNVLMIGEYYPLLEIRAAILAKIEACVAQCSTSEFFTLAAEQRFDLVVLCHTIPDAARSSIVTDVRRRWPQARIMQFFTGYGRPSTRPDVDAFVPATEPAELIRRATELLEKATHNQKLRTGPPPGSLANLCYFYSAVIGARRSLLGGNSHSWV